jgi:hypothetical protein
MQRIVMFCKDFKIIRGATLADVAAQRWRAVEDANSGQRFNADK